MSTIEPPWPIPGHRRRRRVHDDAFKADAVAAARRPGISIAAVALTKGINANLLRRWIQDAESREPKLEPEPKSTMPVRASEPVTSAAFVAVRLPDQPKSIDTIQLEVRRGDTTISVTWPTSVVAECASLLREMLR